jgi:hypothetical protein
LDEAIRHDGQQFSGRDAEELNETDKHFFPGQRQHLEPNRIIEILFLDDNGSEAQRHDSVFSNPAVDRFEAIT